VVEVKEDGEIVLRSEPPVFLDLANPQPINLKNLQLRLVDNEYRPVQVRGNCVATLLLAASDES
jgi:hypothetical protein